MSFADSIIAIFSEIANHPVEFLVFLRDFLLFLFDALDSHFFSYYFLPLFFIGYFSNLHKISSIEVRRALVFFRFTFLFIIGVLFLMVFSETYANLDLYIVVSFFLRIFYLRLFEIFPWFWVIFVLQGCLIIIKWLEMVFDRYDIGNKLSERIKNQKIKHFFTIERQKKAISIIFLITISSISYYSFLIRRYEYDRYDKNHITLAILWVGNYFNENPLDENRTMFGEPVERGWLYVLIYEPNLNIQFIDDAMLESYETFLSYFNQTACYALINLAVLMELSADFQNDFIVLYENERYVFLELIV